MTSVLGVSVGASAIRIARPSVAVPENGGTGQSFDIQSVDVTRSRAEELAAESIGVAMESSEEISATSVAYRSAPQAKAVRAAMARQNLDNYQLVPEITAIVEHLEATGEIAGLSTVAVYDLGSSGLSISVVDIDRREVVYAERTSEISGDYFDSLVREQQIAAGRVGAPQSPVEFAVLDLLCKDAKERLSANSAVATPSDSGLILLSRDSFDALITLAIEASARLTRDVIMRSDQHVEAIVGVGGGSRIPLVSNVLKRWTSLPVILPDNPESIAARGAAMLARPAATAVRQDAPRVATWSPIAPLKMNHRREISGAGLAVSSLAVIAAIGLALGYGGQMLDGAADGNGGPTTTLPQVPPRTTIGEPSIAVAPVPTSVAMPTTTTKPPETTEELQRTTDQTSSSLSTTPAPPTIGIPGLPPIYLPTIPPELIPPPPPPPPPLPELPQLPPPPPMPELPPPPVLPPPPELPVINIPPFP
ncbi:Hsp70 family protein [Antrihabitans sp. YC2-6]|uniref:Hsp70 family protein n=1 Tax=Antrihabitans sp. YC2-6 TaxID=2799498 RepID=UPI0018F73B70|nr:Hsp70 family protein [Antrihabitans sp. YC2-6]MBJ8348673.1 Hsp70 family protein [Antrihabitans sp. YC2-6]